MKVEQEWDLSLASAFNLLGSSALDSSPLLLFLHKETKRVRSKGEEPHSNVLSFSPSKHLSSSFCSLAQAVGADTNTVVSPALAVSRILRHFTPQTSFGSRIGLIGSHVYSVLGLSDTRMNPITIQREQNSPSPGDLSRLHLMFLFYFSHSLLDYFYFYLKCC